MKLRSSGNSGFTLAETAVASGVVAIILISIVIGGVSLQRMFAGSDGSLKAVADQSRVLDYLMRDLRQALTVTVTNAGQTLTVTVPDYVDSATGKPRVPGIQPGISSYGLPRGIVDYGSGVTVKYFPANAPVSPSTTYVYQSNGPFLIREVTNAGVTTQTVISLDCTTLQINLTDKTTTVLASVSFAPRFNFQNLTSERDGTIIYATATLRNTRRN